jgi:hypothetical protein
VEVRVGFYVTNLASLDQASESFEIADSPKATWTEPRLAFSSEAGVEKEIDPKSIWTPVPQVQIGRDGRAEFHLPAHGSIRSQKRDSRIVGRIALYVHDLD